MGWSLDDEDWAWNLKWPVPFQSFQSNCFRCYILGFRGNHPLTCCHSHSAASSHWATEDGKLFLTLPTKVVHCLNETSPLSILTAVAIGWLDVRYQQGDCNPTQTDSSLLGCEANDQWPTKVAIVRTKHTNSHNFKARNNFGVNDFERLSHLTKPGFTLSPGFFL